jgi:hypothetical protein
VIFPMKKVEADGCITGTCNVGGAFYCGSNCFCDFLYPVTSPVGVCRYLYSSEDLKKKVQEHPNLCWSHGECIEKGSGNYCARFPNLKHGLCFASVSEAENVIKMASSSKFKNDSLKMSLPA